MRPLFFSPIGFLLLVLLASSCPGWSAETEPAQAVGPDSIDKNRSARLEALRAELAQETGDPRALARLGWLLLEEGEADAAISSFDRALELNPRSADAKTGKGAALGRKGKLEAAEAILMEALAHNPNPVRVHYELGLVYESLGAPEKALAEFKTAAEKFRQGRR